MNAEKTQLSTVYIESQGKKEPVAVVIPTGQERTPTLYRLTRMDMDDIQDLINTASKPERKL